MLNDQESFTVDHEGPESGEQYKGSFRVRMRMSTADRLRIDEVRRATLGAFPDNPSDYVARLAACLAELSVRLDSKSIPDWYKDPFSLPDGDAVVPAVYEAMSKVVAAAYERHRADIEKKRAGLGKVAEDIKKAE